MLLLIRTTWHLTHGRLGASDMWTLENFQAGSVFVAILCQRTVSTMFLCALSLPLQQTAAKSFDLLIHTMRNLFSLTSNAIWPIMTKSRSPKSENRNLWRQEMPVISPCGQPSHCPMRAFRCLRVRIHACLFCRDGREPVFAGLIGLLFDSWGGNKQPTGSSCESKQ